MDTLTSPTMASICPSLYNDTFETSSFASSRPESLIDYEPTSLVSFLSHHLPSLSSSKRGQLVDSNVSPLIEDWMEGNDPTSYALSVVSFWILFSIVLITWLLLLWILSKCIRVHTRRKRSTGRQYLVSELAIHQHELVSPSSPLDHSHSNYQRPFQHITVGSENQNIVPSSNRDNGPRSQQCRPQRHQSQSSDFLIDHDHIPQQDDVFTTVAAADPFNKQTQQQNQSQHYSQDFSDLSNGLSRQDSDVQSPIPPETQSIECWSVSDGTSVDTISVYLSDCNERRKKLSKKLLSESVSHDSSTIKLLSESLSSDNSTNQLSSSEESTSFHTISLEDVMRNVHLEDVNTEYRHKTHVGLEEFSLTSEHDMSATASSLDDSFPTNIVEDGILFSEDDYDNSPSSLWLPPTSSLTVKVNDAVMYETNDNHHHSSPSSILKYSQFASKAVTRKRQLEQYAQAVKTSTSVASIKNGTTTNKSNSYTTTRTKLGGITGEGTEKGKHTHPNNIKNDGKTVLALTDVNLSIQSESLTIFDDDATETPETSPTSTTVAGGTTEFQYHQHGISIKTQSHLTYGPKSNDHGSYDSPKRRRRERRQYHPRQAHFDENDSSRRKLDRSIWHNNKDNGCTAHSRVVSLIALAACTCLIITTFMFAMNVVWTIQLQAQKAPLYWNEMVSTVVKQVSEATDRMQEQHVSVLRQTWNVWQSLDSSCPSVQKHLCSSTSFHEPTNDAMAPFWKSTNRTIECDLDGIPLQSSWEEWSEGAQINSMIDAIVPHAAMFQAQDAAVNFWTFHSEIIDQYEPAWTVLLYVALIVNVCMALFCFGIMCTIAMPSENQPFQRLDAPFCWCTAQSFAVIFWILVILEWTFGLWFSVQAITTIDMCGAGSNGPNDVAVELLDRWMLQHADSIVFVKKWKSLLQHCHAGEATNNTLSMSSTWNTTLLTETTHQLVIFLNELSSNAYFEVCGVSMWPLYDAIQKLLDQFCSWHRMVQVFDEQTQNCDAWMTTVYAPLVHDTICTQGSETLVTITVTQMIILVMAVLIWTCYRGTMILPLAEVKSDNDEVEDSGAATSLRLSC